jgi:hypothetical protein
MSEWNSDGKAFLTLPEGEGSPIIGAIFLSNSTFRECYFEKITFVGTPADTRNMLPAIDVVSLKDWKERAKWSDKKH